MKKSDKRAIKEMFKLIMTGILYPPANEDDRSELLEKYETLCWKLEEWIKEE